MPDAAQTIAICDELGKLWYGRNAKFRDWYDILALYDYLKQKGMESVISNNPRTYYNAALHLLTPPTPPIRIPVEGLDPETTSWANQLEEAIRESWYGLDRRYRRRARKGWMQYVVGLMLVTGWYSVLCMVVEDQLIAEAWNPIEVYPDWDGLELYRCAHVFILRGNQARQFVSRRGWNLKRVIGGPYDTVTIYDLWEVDGNKVTNTTVADTTLVKPTRAEPFDSIPIFVGPVGGLPDDGPISATRARAINQDWRSEVGQSIFATNEGMYNNHNRMMTFMQQIVRDTAQPKYWEKGQNPGILTPEALEKRGPIFRLGQGDEIGTLQMPGIPLELSSILSQYEGMIQRGGIPAAIFGQMAASMPVGAMTQVAAATVQALALFHRATVDLLGDVINTWADGIIDGTYKGVSVRPPSSIPRRLLRFDATFPLHIPGDLIQRATVLRMISPEAQLSPVTGLDLLFPEIEDPLGEVAKVRAAAAGRHPIFLTLGLVSALREEARLLRSQGLTEDAELLERAESVVRASLEGVMLGQQNGGGRPPGGVPPAGMSPGAQEELERLGAGVTQQ